MVHEQRATELEAAKKVVEETLIPEGGPMSDISKTDEVAVVGLLKIREVGVQG